jgi:hypothetical protein
MKRREARHPGESFQGQIIIQVFTHVVDNGIDALDIEILLGRPR